MGQIKNNGVKQIKKRILAVCFVLAVAGISETTVYAEKEPTFKATEETIVAEAYVGKVNVDVLNVRTGFGAGYEQLEVNGNKIVLMDGDLVAVMASGTSKDGYLWYEVRWVEDETEYHGYVRAKYVTLTEQTAVPIPTPTPTETPTPTPDPTPTEIPTPTDTPVPMPTEAPKSNGTSKAMTAIGLVMLLLLLAAGIYLYVIKKKMDTVKTETSEKIDSLRKMQLKKEKKAGEALKENAEEKPEEPVKETAVRQKPSYEADADLLARKEHARLVNEEMMERSRFYDPAEEKKKQDELKKLSESLKEKEILKEEIDNLIPGELVYHEYFGKGVVFDNSDVKVIEIRFGTDVRFINKASCVTKKLMRKV